VGGGLCSRIKMCCRSYSVVLKVVLGLSMRFRPCVVSVMTTGFANENVVLFCLYCVESSFRFGY
jgi:hypothetical protein